MRRALAFFCSVAAAVIGSASGCPSHAPLGVASAGPTGGGLGGSGGGGGAAGMGGAEVDGCTKACESLYDCGLVVESGAQLCPGFDGTMREQQTFLLGDGVTDGCIATCEENKLLETIDPSNDCAGTIEKLKGFYEPFKDVCELGIAAGAGGGGGTGGAAGVGGAGGAGGGA